MSDSQAVCSAFCPFMSTLTALFWLASQVLTCFYNLSVFAFQQIYELGKLDTSASLLRRDQWRCHPQWTTTRKCIDNTCDLKYNFFQNKCKGANTQSPIECSLCFQPGQNDSIPRPVMQQLLQHCCLVEVRRQNTLICLLVIFLVLIVAAAILCIFKEIRQFTRAHRQRKALERRDHELGQFDGELDHGNADAMQVHDTYELTSRSSLRVPVIPTAVALPSNSTSAGRSTSISHEQHLSRLRTTSGSFSSNDSTLPMTTKIAREGLPVCLSGAATTEQEQV